MAVFEQNRLKNQDMYAFLRSSWADNWGRPTSSSTTSRLVRANRWWRSEEIQADHEQVLQVILKISEASYYIYYFFLPVCFFSDWMAFSCSCHFFITVCPLAKYSHAVYVNSGVRHPVGLDDVSNHLLRVLDDKVVRVLWFDTRFVLLIVWKPTLGRSDCTFCPLLHVILHTLRVPSERFVGSSSERPVSLCLALVFVLNLVRHGQNASGIDAQRVADKSLNT